MPTNYSLYTISLVHICIPSCIRFKGYVTAHCSVRLYQLRKAVLKNKNKTVLKYKEKKNMYKSKEKMTSKYINMKKKKNHNKSEILPKHIVLAITHAILVCFSSK